jgi:hypothetical protein
MQPSRDYEFRATFLWPRNKPEELSGEENSTPTRILPTDINQRLPGHVRHSRQALIARFLSSHAGLLD